MDKIKIANAMENMICRVLKAENLLLDAKTKADYKRGMEVACHYNGMEDEWKLLCDLRTEIEMDGLKVSKGGRSKQRATAIKKLSEELHKQFANTRPYAAGVNTDLNTHKDVLVHGNYGIMFNENVPECAVKSPDYRIQGTHFSKYYNEGAITHRFTLSAGTIETIYKTRKASAGRLWNKSADRAVAFGTEDKVVQFKVNIEYLFDVVRCIENDDRSFELCFVKYNKGIIIKTDHGTGLVMPVLSNDDTPYDNDYVLS